MWDDHATVGPWGLFALATSSAEPGEEAPLTLKTAPRPGTAVESPPGSVLTRMDSGVQPRRYTVELTLDPRQEQFQGLVELELSLREPTRQLWLRGTGLTVQGASVTARGSTRPARVTRQGEDRLGFTLERPVGPGPVTLRVAYQGRASAQDATGVVRSSEGGHWYAVAWLQPTDARRILPCLDDTAFQVPWQLTLRLNPEDRAYADMPVASMELGPDGLRLVRFLPVTPHGLLAFTVGPAQEEVARTQRFPELAGQDSALQHAPVLSALRGGGRTPSA
jgi:aminopeptidase N